MTTNFGLCLECELQLGPGYIARNLTIMLCLLALPVNFSGSVYF